MEKQNNQFSLFNASGLSDSATPRTAAQQASLSITNSWSLLKLMSIKSVMPSNHLILYPALSSCRQSFPIMHTQSGPVVVGLHNRVGSEQAHIQKSAVAQGPPYCPKPICFIPSPPIRSKA